MAAYDLIVAKNGPRVAIPPAPLICMLQEQLGLKLGSKKEDVEVIVVDHVERSPTEN